MSGDNSCRKNYLLQVAGLTCMLLLICNFKGEKLDWRWGQKK